MKATKRATAKLGICRETLRVLATLELTRVLGGGAAVQAQDSNGEVCVEADFNRIVVG